MRLKFKIYRSVEVELVFDYERSVQEIVKCEELDIFLVPP